MSSEAVGTVTRLRGLSDEHFRILFWIADQCTADWSMIEIHYLAQQCEMDEEHLVRSMRKLFKRHPAFDGLRINHPDDRCPGPNRLEGSIDWRSLQ